MTTPRPRLTDAVLREALARRAVGPNNGAELVGEVLTAVDASPQVRAWWQWQVGSQRRLLAVLVLALLLMSAAVGFALVASGVVPNPESDAGYIAFVTATYDPTGAEPPANPRIFSVPPDAGDPTLLAAVPGEVVPPMSRPQFGPGGTPADHRNTMLIGPAVSWSPDGQRIAFRLFNGAPGIYVMNRDGSGLTRLIELPLDLRSTMTFSDALDWSPDGSRIAYVYPYGSPMGPRAFPLYVVNVDDSQPVPIDLDTLASRTVAWSPDGSEIAFVRSYTHRTSGLFVVNADGTGERRLTDAELGGHIDAVAWSPDGSRIAFTRNGNPDSENSTLHVVNADGTGLRDLGQMWLAGCCIFVGLDDALAWSPDGELIALVDGRNDATHDSYVRDVIVLVNADGSGQRVLTDGSHFDWSPDGSRLVVSDAGSPRLEVPPCRTCSLDPRFDSYSIYVINADGTGRRWLAEGEFPAWSPGTASN